MDKHEVATIVLAVLGSAIATAIPLITLLAKAFHVISELRLQIVQNRNDIEMLADKTELITRQTIERIDHFTTRNRGEMYALNTQLRELQNYLSKTTSFEIRSQ